MEAKPKIITMGRQSSREPEREDDESGDDDDVEVPEGIDATVRLMYLANEGDLEGINEILDSGVNINYRDIDGRMALHIAACQGRTDVVELLLKRGAEIDPKDRWGSTPLADAMYYKHHDVIKLLEKHGAKRPMAPMHVQNAREIPEYEIDPKELDFTKSVEITKGTFRTASWRGIEVAVKTIGDDLITDEDKVKAFRNELALLQKIRHPNVVQFLGAVTQSSPMIIVTEYLPKGDLCSFLERKGALRPRTAVKFALDIARGMNYLHENKPEAIIHRDLEPSNVLRDDSGHLKVADFGVSKLMKVAKTVREDKPIMCLDTSCRYVAPEVFRNEEYDMKVDVFSFALILQEMIEGRPPFSTKQEDEVPKAYVAKERPPFRAPAKLYSHGLRELIEQCWSENPTRRPTFREIIERLAAIDNRFNQKSRWKLYCFRAELCTGCAYRSILLQTMSQLFDLTKSDDQMPYKYAKATSLVIIWRTSFGLYDLNEPFDGRFDFVNSIQRMFQALKSFPPNCNEIIELTDEMNQEGLLLDSWWFLWSCLTAIIGKVRGLMRCFQNFTSIWKKDHSSRSSRSSRSSTTR